MGVLSTSKLIHDIIWKILISELKTHSDLRFPNMTGDSMNSINTLFSKFVRHRCLFIEQLFFRFVIIQRLRMIFY